MKVHVINISENPLPEYKTKASAGADVYARCGPKAIKPGDSALIPTGLKVKIPEGYEIQVRPRSGLAAKQQVTVLNSPGTIDADFVGEIMVILINHGKSDFIVSNGMRIGQLVLTKVEQIEWVEVNDLIETERGENGFGSTGLK